MSCVIDKPKPVPSYLLCSWRKAAGIFLNFFGLFRHPCPNRQDHFVLFARRSYGSIWRGTLPASHFRPPLQLVSHRVKALLHRSRFTREKSSLIKFTSPTGWIELQVNVHVDRSLCRASHAMGRRDLTNFFDSADLKALGRSLLPESSAMLGAWKVTMPICTRKPSARELSSDCFGHL